MRYPLPALLCLALFAPACMAQSRPADATAGAPADAPRSAMGRVMGIMIEALRQDAMRAEASAGTLPEPPNAMELTGGESGDTGLQVIEVGAAFRPSSAPARAAADRSAATATHSRCDDQPCDQPDVQPVDPGFVPKLRIASQK